MLETNQGLPHLFDEFQQHGVCIDGFQLYSYSLLLCFNSTNPSRVHLVQGVERQQKFKILFVEYSHNEP